MDENRWQEMSLRKVATSPDSQPDHQDRYNGDMLDAQILRSASMRKSQPSKRRLTQADDDVKLGLRGLDQAEAYKKQGNLRMAKEIYEKSLELLIRRLKDTTQSGFDQETLQARVEVAFRDAESIKEKLRISDQNQDSNAISDSFRSTMQNLSAALSSALKRPEPAKPAAAPVRAASHQKPAVAPVKAAARQNISQRTVAKQRIIRPTRKAPQQRTLRSPPASPTDGEADDAKRVILSDFLVSQTEISETSWEEIAGLAQAKQSLQETAILPLIRPDLFTGLRKPQNVLLWGPPGTGKTMMVRAVAKESGSHLFAVTASVMTSKWMGDSEKLVKKLFQVAREASPSIIFIDEMDSLLSSRKSDGEHEASRRLKTEFMVQTDGMTKESKGVLVLACTNCPWDVDSAVMRRFPRRIYVPLPDPVARTALIKTLLKKAKKHTLQSKEISQLVAKTKGFSGSDIASIASEASFGPLRSLGGLEAIRNARAKDVRPMSYADFEQVLSQTTRSVTKEQLSRYGEWQKSQQS